MIDDTKLLAIINSQIASAIGGYNSDLETDQTKALDYYYGRAYGDEVPGQSSIVTRDVLETIEWIMPSLMRIFAGGDRYVEFDPQGEEDEDQAEQETDFVNYVFNKENDGFMVLYTWIKGALLLKNSYCKVWVEEEERTTVTTYDNLTDMGLAQVINTKGVEALEHTEYETEYGLAHTLKVRQATKEKICRVEAIPQEEIGVSRMSKALSLKDCPFSYHRRSMSAAELLSLGYDKKVIDRLSSWDGEKYGPLEIARKNTDDEYATLMDAPDEATRLITVYECYIRMDMEDDGTDGLWKVTMSGNEILDKEEIDFVPIPVLCPIPMPHTHIGMSVADLVMDIQRIRSVIMRMMLNNLYLTNNPEKEVLEKHVNMDDLLTSVAGGIKRVKQMGSIREISVPFTAGASIPMLDILDKQKEQRTGINRSTMGLDANTLAQSTEGAFMGAMEQANQRIEMLARLFAETGIKDMFWMIHKQVSTHYDKAKYIKLRGEYVNVTPTEWKERYNMSVNVGLGTGNKDKEVSQLWAIAQKQEEHMLQGSPLVTAKNLYNTYRKLINKSGLKEVDLFFTDPDSPEAQQAAQAKQQAQQPDANMIMIQANKAIEDQKAMLIKQKQDQDAYFRQKEHEYRERELALREQEQSIRANSDAANIESKRYIADQDKETKLMIENMKTGATMQEAISQVLSAESQRNDAILTASINGILDAIHGMTMQNAEAMQGMANDMRQQVQTVAGQLSRPKRIIYNDEGDPIRVEQEAE